jgi:Putative transposase/Transposase zinc-binding domain
MCPKCQALKRERWVEARKREILPCKYFHGVFTLPHSINPLALCNKRLVYALLFEAVSETLQRFALRELHGNLGFISVLHTWNQKVLDHIHLHCLIPAGAIHSRSGQWVPCRRSEFLFPVRALSVVFRAKFLEKLKARRAELKLPPHIGYLEDLASFQDFIDHAWKEEFVVYTKQPFAGPEQVIEYLGRYVHRVAISNYRILKIEGDQVSFSYRDRADGNTEKVETVSGVEFLRRFMTHALPKGFQRIRYHGFLANRCKEKNVDKIYRELSIKRLIAALQPITARDYIQQRLGIDITRCPACSQGTLHNRAYAPEPRAQPP